MENEQIKWFNERKPVENNCIDIKTVSWSSVYEEEEEKKRENI